jgi:capsular polysaccharide biosynthesis protein
VSWAEIVRAAALVAVIALIAGAAGYAISAGQPEEYRATTELLFEGFTTPELGVLGAGFGVGGSEADRRAATNELLADSRDIAVRVARAAPELRYSAGQVDARVSTQLVGGSDIIRITATADGRRKAERLVRIYRRELKAMRRERERTRATEAIRALERAHDALPAPQRRGARGDVLRVQIGALEVMRRLGTGLPIVTEGAFAPAAAVSPATSRNLIFGLVFGTLVGVGLVALRQAAKRQQAATASGVRDQQDVRSDWD